MTVSTRLDPQRVCLLLPRWKLVRFMLVGASFILLLTTFRSLVHQYTHVDHFWPSASAVLGMDHKGISSILQHFLPRTRNAVSLYATSEVYLCNALLILDSLAKVRTKADRLLLHPREWTTQNNTGTNIDEFLARAKDLGARLMPVEIQHSDDGDGTWADSYSKLLAFNMTDYRRVLSLDSDALVMQSIDDVFSSPATPIAAPWAYWLDNPFLSSQFFLIEPSEREWDRVHQLIQHHKEGDFDMEIINTLYNSTASIIPHRPYDLLSGELRAHNHSAYLGDPLAAWDVDAELTNARFVHFSDWPTPKPWLASENDLELGKPDCLPGPPEDCRNRDAWLWLYRDFRKRMERVCYS